MDDPLYPGWTVPPHLLPAVDEADQNEAMDVQPPPSQDDPSQAAGPALFVGAATAGLPSPIDSPGRQVLGVTASQGSPKVKKASKKKRGRTPPYWFS